MSTLLNRKTASLVLVTLMVSFPVVTVGETVNADKQVQAEAAQLFAALVADLQQQETSVEKEVATTSLPFETILHTTHGFPDYQGTTTRQVITMYEEWETLWNELHEQHASTSEIIDVNFETHHVIAVFQGVQNSGGHAIEIMSIEEVDDETDRKSVV